MRRIEWAAAGIAVVALACSRDANAQETREVAVPNTPVIVTGSIMLGLAYTTSVAVAAKSELPADDNLYIPLVGPWLDLADRAGCAAGGNPACNSNKVLIVVDGVAQGLGAAQILGGFVFPARRVVSTRLTPTATRHGVGLTASGAF
jgi:hypothetical protein